MALVMMISAGHFVALIVMISVCGDVVAADYLFYFLRGGAG